MPSASFGYLALGVIIASSHILEIFLFEEIDACSIKALFSFLANFRSPFTFRSKK
jgi:hypothetical protein